VFNSKVGEQQIRIQYGIDNMNVLKINKYGTGLIWTHGCSLIFSFVDMRRSWDDRFDLNSNTSIMYAWMKTRDSNYTQHKSASTSSGVRRKFPRESWEWLKINLKIQWIFLIFNALSKKVMSTKKINFNFEIFEILHHYL